MNKLQDFARWLSRIGYLQKSKEPFTGEVLERLLPADIKHDINTNFTQDNVDKGLVHLIANDDVQPVCSFNDTLIVVEQLQVMMANKWGANSRKNINEDAVAHILESFEGNFIAVKLRYRSAEAWKSQMMALCTDIAQRLLNTPVNMYEVRNRNAFAVVAEQTATYKPKTPFFVLSALRVAKGIQATLQNNPNRYTGIIDELSVVDVDLERNILTMVIKTGGEVLEVISTPNMMYCSTTGQYIHSVGGGVMPKMIIHHPISSELFGDVIQVLRDQYRSIYTKSVAYIDGEVALTDEKDLKRMERMARLFQITTDDLPDMFTTIKDNKLVLDVFKGNNHTIFEVTPTYILDTEKMLILYVRTPQMSQADIEAKLQHSLAYYPRLSPAQAKLIYTAFIQSYDLRRSIKPKKR